MPLPVSLSAVADELDMLTDESQAFVNRKTGELVALTHDELAMAEDDEPTDDLPEWEQEILEKARAVAESSDWVALPDRFEIHEWSIMEGFALGRREERQRDSLSEAIRGQGAFGRFGDLVNRLGIGDEWHEYRRRRLEEIAAARLDEYGIPYTREE